MARSQQTGKSQPRTTHTRLDPVTPQVGLFRAVSDNPNDKAPSPKNGIVYQQIHDGVEVQFRAAGQCDATDWRHFLAVAALSGLEGERFNASSNTQPLATLWERFLSEGTASERDGLRLRTTAYAILREAGFTDTGPNRKRLTETLMRLSTVRQFLRKGNRVLSSANLLSFAHDEDSGELSIGLSPQMARTILGESKQHVRISLSDVRALEHPAAVILHGVLSARLRPGDRRPAIYGLDTLATAAYGPSDNATTSRTRRSRIRKALDDLNRLPQWRVMEEGNRVCIWRGDVPGLSPSMSDIALWLSETPQEKGPPDRRG